MFFGIMMLFALMNGFLTSSSGVDAWGHIGGFYVGLCLSVFVLRTTEMSDYRK